MNAVYARQSLDKKDSISIETQIALCKQEIGNEPIKIYIDKGFSGKNTNRPKFKELMNDVKHDKIERVVVYKLDRLSRSLLDFAEMIDVFNKHNVKFTSTREKFDTNTPIGNAMLSIIMVFAQLERETIQVRTRDSYHARMEMGAYDAQPPYGYSKSIVLVNGKRVHTIEPHEPECQIFKEIFEKYSTTSASLGSIVKDLNKKGVLSRTHSEWTSCTLSNMLANPIFVKADADIYKFYHSQGVKIVNTVDDFDGIHGCITYGNWDKKYRKFWQLDTLTIAIGLQKGIVDSQTFLRCQHRLRENKQISNFSRGKHSWLTGLIKCGYCGKAMKVMFSNANKGKLKFTCSGAYNTGICEESPKIAVSEVEAEVQKQIFLHVEKNNRLVYKETIDTESFINQYKIEISKIDAKIDNLIDALASGTETSKNYIDVKIAELDKQKCGIKRQMEDYITQNSEEQIATAQFKDTIPMWEKMSISQKRDLAGLLIKEVQIFHDKIQIVWKYNLS